MANIELTLTPASPTGSMIFTLGAPGPQGLAGTMAVGTVTTGAPGSSASIVNVGTPSAAILDFEIPRGDQGIQGVQGIQGQKGDKGDKGEQGDPGPSGVAYATSPLSYDSGTKTVSISTTPSFYTITATSGSNYSIVQPSAITITQSGHGQFVFQPSQGIVFPDSTVQTTAFTGTVSTAWGSITGTLSSQTDLSNALAGKYSTSNPAGYISSSALIGYATESWVTTQLGSYLTTSSAASTYYPLANPSGFIGDAPSDNVIYARFNGSWVNAGDVTPSWGNIIGDISNQIDLQNALGAKYDASNPAGFIDASYLNGYATESWVQSQGYITSSAGFATESWVQNQGYATLAGSTFTGRVQFANTDTSVSPVNITPYVSTPSSLTNGDVWFDHGQGRMAYYYSGVGVRYVSNTTDLGGYYPSSNPSGFITSSALTPYALLSGATFTGKVNFTSVGGAAGLNVGIGGTSTSATSNGDLWITTGGTNLNFRDGTGSWRILVNTSNTNTFSAPQIIDTTATTAALRVTQKGTGNAIEIEDSATPDATRFVVDQFGKVGIGVAPDATAAIKIDGNGMSFNGLVFNPTATSAHTGGTDTLDLLVTINGTNYRIGLRPA